MICTDCWRPLERAAPYALTASSEVQSRWEYIIEFESQLLVALHGRTPDQFKFNFTSASQLVNQVRDICRLLTHLPWPYSPYDRWNSPYDIALNEFFRAGPVLGPLQRRFRFTEHPFPLTNALMTKRRCMLAAVCAILDPSPETGRALFGETTRPAIETFVAFVSKDALDQILAQSGRWSPKMVQRVEAARLSRRPVTPSKRQWRLPPITTAQNGRISVVS